MDTPTTTPTVRIQVKTNHSTLRHVLYGNIAEIAEFYVLLRVSGMNRVVAIATENCCYSNGGLLLYGNVGIDAILTGVVFMVRVLLS